MNKRRVFELALGGLLVLVIIVFAVLNSSRNSGYSNGVAVATKSQSTPSNNSAPQQRHKKTIQPKEQEKPKSALTPQMIKANELAAEAATAYKELMSYPKLGHSHEVGNFNITVNSISRYKNIASDGMVESTANGVYFLVSITIRNDGNTPQTIADSMFQIDSENMNGNMDTYSPDSTAEIFANNNGGFELSSLNPGVSQTGYLVFDMPEKLYLSNMELYHLHVATGVFGLGATQNFSFIK